MRRHSRIAVRPSRYSPWCPGISRKDGKRHTDYVKDYWSKLLPFTDGYYTNEVADEHQPKIDENYRGNIGRLRQLKRQYDPQNLFRLNANILPA